MSYEEVVKEKLKKLKDKKEILVLSIESSCDETSVAVVKNGREILSNIVATQIDIHKRFGGVVPEVASRNHIMQINNCLVLALEKANVSLDDIDLIAVTYGAGLIGALMVGVNFAKALSYAKKIPLIKVDHIKGHISANYLCFKDLTPPFVCLLVSGAHTEIIKVSDYDKFEILGASLDDACGECFDKVARVLNLEYPGGPKIEKLAQKGNATIKFVSENRELNKTFNFSYSGLKTAVINYIHKKRQNNEELNIEDICASFQTEAFDELVNKTIRATKTLSKEYNKIVIAGGVSANMYLRNLMLEKGKENGYEIYFPEIKLCTDNAAMIGSAGYYNFIKNINIANLSLSPKARIDI